MPEGLRVITNLPDFRRQLAEVGAKVERRVVTNAVRAAARIFRDRARSFAPVLRDPDPRRVPGALQRAIVVARSREGQRGTVAYFVGVRASKAQRGRGIDPFYWRFLEAGWAPRGPGQRLKGGKRRKALERTRNAGARIERPFLAPAFQAAQGAALAAFESRVDAELAKVTR